MTFMRGHGKAVAGVSHTMAVNQQILIDLVKPEMQSVTVEGTSKDWL